MRPCAALLALCALVAPAGCDGEKAPAPAPSATVSVLAPVPAPEGLLAELTIPAPEATWNEARAIVGGPALFLPQSFGGLLSTALGLPITSAIEIDGDIPALGAVVKGAPGERPRAAIAVHVKVGERLLDQLTKGDTARFSAKVDQASRITLLEPRGAQAPVALGILANYLIVAREAADVLAVGPYVVRTMPTVAAPRGDDILIEVPEAALRGPIAEGLKASWDGIQPRDRAAPGAAIPPLLEIEGLVAAALAVAGDLARARIAVNLEADAVRARLALSPRAGGGAASKAASEMTTGDAKRLLDLPRGTLAALMWRDSAASRLEGAPGRAGTVAAFLGKEAAPADREAIETTLRTLAEARGDWVTGGVSFGATGPAGYARVAVADHDKLGQALKGLYALEKMKGVKARLADAKIGLTQGKAVIPGMVGEVARIKLERKDAKDAKDARKPGPGGPPGGGPPSSIEILLKSEKDELYVAAGYDAREALKAVTSGEESLASVAAIRAAVDGLGSEVGFTLVVEPLLLVASAAGKPGAGESAPLVLAFGRDPAKKEIWGRLDLANAALRELARRGL